MGKSLSDIKSLIELLTLEIECLDPASKHAAIVHLEEAIGLLKIRAKHDLKTLVNQNLTEEKQETKLKADSSDRRDAWIFNDDTFVDNIDYESNNETFTVQEKKPQGNNEERKEHQIPNNEIKQEPANQEPVVISLNPATFHGEIASENDMLKCDPCNVYLPKSYTMKRHEEDPNHLARVATVLIKETAKQSVDKSPEKTNNTAPANICNICQKQYKNRADLRQHKNIHTEKYKCQKCKESFSRRSRLELHIRNPESCIKLKKIRSSINVPPVKETIDKSINEMGSISKDESAKEGTERASTLNEISSKPEVGMYLFQCPECPNKYNKKNSLLKHSIVHTGKYVCQKCKEPFQSRRDLEEHIRKPDSCLTLKKRRASRNKSIQIDADRQRLHEVSNEKGIIPEDESVKKETERTTTLNEISKPEVDLNIYQCPECPKKYNKKNSFSKHRLMHTGKYKCPRCEASFNQRSRLYIHTKDPDSCQKLKKIRSIKSVKPNISSDVSGSNSFKETISEIKTNSEEGAAAVKKPDTDTEVPTLEFLSFNFPGITFHPKTRS